MAEAISEEADPESSAEGESAAQKWPAALATLASARVAIISAESRDAAGILSTKVIWAVIAGMCGTVFWITSLAGLIGFIPQVSGLAWFHVSFIIAALHILVIIVAIMALKKKTAPVFGLTKSEFIKDQQWLSSVKEKSTSEN